MLEHANAFRLLAVARYMIRPPIAPERMLGEASSARITGADAPVCPV